ncbi:adenylyl-sulfate kinase [Cohnella luojiensis]|uniref:Adenylyl-sulfate kinase n=2 Tax=Cohnella luojiensis TaxID=652876 RepID=A0A4Y8LYG1_9BACL|nr:adenylyl-sulfate kinase [Cohnella luojiensis]TFE27278.1 adenylyl-sulfate kinase [Cohnella luojiensis]
MQPEVSNADWRRTTLNIRDRYALNGHRSCVLWFTGLSGAGKSTLAAAVERKLYALRIRSYVLDGDNIRQGLNKNLGFAPEDRTENIRRIGEVSKLLSDAGLFAVVACISPYKADRDSVRSMFREGEFIEIYVKCSIEECERRDPKGLYQKARSGEIPNFTGLAAPYEPPVNPELIMDTETRSIAAMADTIMQYLEERELLSL